MAETDEAPLLDINEVKVRFGGLTALVGVSLAVRSHEVLGIVGPNGSGKTTLLNAISGFVPLADGQITFKGESLRGHRPDQISRAGIGRTFQTVQLLEDRTVVENVLLGRYSSHREALGGASIRTRKARRQSRENEEFIRGLLASVGVDSSKERRLANELDNRDRRFVEIARALACEPSLLLLDEPGAGLDAAEKDSLSALIARLKAEHDLTMILIEHDIRFIASASDRLAAMNQGAVIAIGSPTEVIEDSQVIESYIGRTGPAETATT
jgi:branched-chain amino acid transport system ATP-binding protein